MRRIIDEQVDQLLEDGLIEPSYSPHSAPIVLVKKKNGQWRMCVDYRQLNERSVPDAYPLPRITYILERLRHAKFISTLDLKNGYWQIPMATGMFKRLRRANLRINHEKCAFFQRKITYLGHVISEEGIHTDPSKVAAVRELIPPSNLKELRQCIGMASQRYYWPGMHRDVKKHVRQCLSCQKFKTSQQKPAGPMHTRPAEEPFAVIGADFVGPLPRSKQGNTMLLVFFDLFSK
ncbi:hypothetical protein KR215_009953, partial [Drosophila sulfurigaster]